MVAQHPPPAQEVEEILRRPLQDQDHPPQLQCFPPFDDDEFGEDHEDGENGQDDEDGDEDNKEVEKNDHDKGGRPQPASQRRGQQTGRWHPDLPAL